MEMKGRLILAAILISFLLIGMADALSLQVNKTDIVPVVISELKNPAIFNFTIVNNGAADRIEIFSFVGVTFEPGKSINLSSGTTSLEINAYPSDEVRAKEGNYAFEYQIKGIGTDLFKDQMVIGIVKLQNVLDIAPLGINYGDKEATIKITNTHNIDIKGASLSISSVFFDGKETISLKPFASTTISLPIKTDDVKDLAAGSYVVSSTLGLEGATANIKDNVNYAERQNIATSEKSSGWIIRTNSITETNNGNVAIPDRITVTKNILTRLFTSFSAEPLSTERKGLFVYYRWEKEVKPAESWTIDVTTNYTLPFVLIVLVIFSAAAVYIYSRTSLVLKKRCSFVRTRGGQFALKVMINVKARKAIDNIEIFDRIPMAMKLYEKAGMPHKFEESIRRLSWKIGRLNAGEERIFSYIVYSDLRIVGRLELPSATAHFVKDGKQQHVSSNRTFFVSEIHPRY